MLIAALDDIISNRTSGGGAILLQQQHSLAFCYGAQISRRCGRFNRLRLLPEAPADVSELFRVIGQVDLRLLEFAFHGLLKRFQCSQFLLSSQFCGGIGIDMAIDGPIKGSLPLTVKEVSNHSQ